MTSSLFRVLHIHILVTKEGEECQEGNDEGYLLA